MTNILLITSDQQHWSTNRPPEIQTPNLDRLADSGTLFTRAYCPNPTCTPTRASLITGKYPGQHGAYALGTKLPEFEPTLGDLLRAGGYHSALIGKAHFQPLRGSDEFPSQEAYPTLQDLDHWRDFHGPFYGFDHVELARNHTDEAHVGQHYALWMEEKGLENWRDYFQEPTGTQPPQHHQWSLPEEYHYNTWIAERTNAMLDHYKESGGDFFLWASFFDPHPSYLVPEPWATMYDPAALTVPQPIAGEHDANPIHFQLTQQTTPDFSPWEEPGGNAMHGFHSHLHDPDLLAQDIAVYYGMISMMDKYIGVILDHLAALGLADDTLVVFTSDHGHVYGQHGLIAKGAFHYEDLVRVPMIVRQPGVVPAGAESDALQSLVDYAPTFLNLCGQDIPATMTGVDQTGIWQQTGGEPRAHVIVENRHQPTTLHARTLVEARHKITVYLNRDYGEVFDLEEDPDEVNNLWMIDPDLRNRLMLRLLVAEMGKEEPLTPETARWSNKAPAMYEKTLVEGRYEISVRPADAHYTLYDLEADPARRNNLWDKADYAEAQATLVRELLFARMAAEPLWMPRIAGA